MRPRRLPPRRRPHRRRRPPPRKPERTRTRLDTELVRRGLAASRENATELITSGRVTVGGAIADKASRQVARADPIEVLGPAQPFVSRGGLKLLAALEHFGVDVAGRRALDAGVSTGGFTDCLLQHDVAHVVAVDVGHGQLHERVRGDARVEVRERTNIRTLDAAAIGGAVPLVVADLSFISLRTVAPALLACAAADADLVLLVKPQFEAGRAEASRGRGVIRDPEIRARVLEEVSSTYRDLGATIMGMMQSPITGADGNVEYLLHVRSGAR